MPRLNLGSILEDQGHSDEALKEYARALQLDDGLARVHMAVGRILLAKKDYPDAINELKKAADLMPANPMIHELHARALNASGKIDEAVGEFRQAATLDPKNLQVRIELAAALEKKGDWAAAIQEYRSVALADASIDLRSKVGRTDDRDPQREYKEAQQRLADHVAALKSSGKTAEAADLQSRISAMQAAPNLSEQLDAAMRDAMSAARERRYDEAVQDLKHAVELAEKIRHTTSGCSQLSTTLGKH